MVENHGLRRDHSSYHSISVEFNPITALPIIAEIFLTSGGGDPESIQQPNVGISPPAPGMPEPDKGNGKSIREKINDLLNSSQKVPGKKIWNNSGGYQKALDEFNALSPSDVEPIQNSKYEGFQGKLDDGSTISVRSGSSGDQPTIQINSPNSTTAIKVRF